jgi:hypothetical protein
MCDFAVQDMKSNKEKQFREMEEQKYCVRLGKC